VHCEESASASAAAGGTNSAIIAITANIQPEHIEGYFASGFLGHVPKPFRRNELLTVIQSAMIAAAKQDASMCRARTPMLN